MASFIPVTFRERAIRLIQKITARLLTRGRVLAGPFRGMRYISKSYMSAYYPKILGVYERELWETLEQIIKIQPRKIVNIGAAEGYYAVGLAMRLPDTEIYTFDESPIAQDLLEELASANGVEDQIRISGACSIDVLRETLEQHDCALMIVDIEGFEEKLLDAIRIPQLRKCEILLEVHEQANAQLPTQMRDRFSLSHQCNEIMAKPREMEDLPIRIPILMRDSLFGRSVKLMMDEQRSDGRRWLHLKPIQ